MPNPHDMLERIKEVVASVTQEDYSNTPADSALGLDSIRRISLIVALETDFNIEIDTEQLSPETFYSFATLTAFIEKQVAVAE